MIAFLNGTVAAKSADAAIIEVNGVGFAVGMSAHSLAALPDIGKPATVHTYLQVREDALTLYGFAEQDEKALFMRLIGVSGVGPKVALAALSSFTPQALTAAIISSDVKAVSSIPGVGKKTAQRIILELQGTLEAPDAADAGASPSRATAAFASAVEALLSMGFTSAEADIALKGAPESGSDAVLLQYALKRLGA